MIAVDGTGASDYRYSSPTELFTCSFPKRRDRLRFQGSQNLQKYVPSQETPVDGFSTLYDDKHLFNRNDLKRCSLDTKTRRNAACLASHPQLLGKGGNSRQVMDTAGHTKSVVSQIDR